MHISMIVKSLILTSCLAIPALGQAAYLYQTTARCGIGSANAVFGTDSAFNTCNYSPVSSIHAAASVTTPISPQLNGVLGAKSSLRILNLDNEYISGIVARTRTQYTDLVTFTTSTVPENAEFVVRISAGMTGGNAIDDISLGFPLSSSGELTVRIGGGSSTDTSVLQTGGGTSWDSPFRAFDITVRNGQALGLSMILETSAAVGTGIASGTALVTANFANTAGITGFEYFDLNGNPISGEFSSVDGLALYDPSVVPVPAAVWLFGSGLIGLIGLARRKKV